MSRTRIYQAASLAPQTTIRLDESASHHLARVLRAHVGDALTLFNGDGNNYSAIITSINKKHVDVDITAVTACNVESPIDIILAQGVARGEKMDFIIQKAVELGAKTISPLITERCNVKLDHEREEKRLQHWRAITISACEQSGRTQLPDLHAPQSLAAWLSNNHADIRFVLSPHVTPKLPTIKSDNHFTIALLIGPEGGLSESEIALAMQHGFQPLNLGPRVLRTETATIAALSAIQTLYGDFS